MRTCSVNGCGSAHYGKGFCQKHLVRFKKYGDPNGGQFHAPVDVRFWRNVDRAGDAECWNWKGTSASGAYGTIGLGGRGAGSTLAHRFSYELHKGPIPDDMLVMHTCDNRACVNPAHLKLGTYSDNTLDAVTKGRWPQSRHGKYVRGADHGNSKLTEEIVRAIRVSLLPDTQLARVLGIDRTTVADVRTGRTWSHVT